MLFLGTKKYPEPSVARIEVLIFGPGGAYDAYDMAL